MYDRLHADSPAARLGEPGKVCRHDPHSAVRTFFTMLMLSVPVWILTPVVASFASLVLPQLMPAIFIAGENNGRSTGDVPYALYARAGILLALGCLAVLAMNLWFGMRVRFTWIPVAAGCAGVVVFLWLSTIQGGAPWQWDITPIAITAGALAAQFATDAQDARLAQVCRRRPWEH